jgi:hypothetical protein
MLDKCDYKIVTPTRFGTHVPYSGSMKSHTVFEQDKQGTYNEKLRWVRETTVAVENQ